MFDLQMIDVGLGLILVYLLLSIVCTAANELIASGMKLRGRTLQSGLKALIEDIEVPGLKDRFMEHPLIKSLAGNGGKPSYISNRTFAMALLDLICSEKQGINEDGTDIRSAIEALPEGSELKQALLVLLDDAGDDIKEFLGNVEQWFDDVMDRVSGWYKRRTQWIVLGLSFVFTVVLNVDTMEIAGSLSNDPVLRKALVGQAEKVVEERGSSEASQPATTDTLATDIKVALNSMQSAMGEIHDLGIPLGWKEKPNGWDWVNKVAGLLLTILAASLGAPFWFDILGRVSNVRGAGLSPSDGRKKQNGQAGPGAAGGGSP